MIADLERYRFAADNLHGVATVAVLCATCGERNDWDGRIHVFDHLYPSLADVQKVISEHEDDQHGVDPETLRIAAELVTTGALHGSPSMLQRRLRQDHGIVVSFAESQGIFGRLQAAGVVGPVDDRTHAYSVLLTRETALAAVRS